MCLVCSCVSCEHRLGFFVAGILLTCYAVHFLGCCDYLQICWKKKLVAREVFFVSMSFDLLTNRAPEKKVFCVVFYLRIGFKMSWLWPWAFPIYIYQTLSNGSQCGFNFTRVLCANRYFCAPTQVLSTIQRKAWYISQRRDGIPFTLWIVSHLSVDSRFKVQNHTLYDF